MTARKRKQPKKKKAQRGPGLVTAGLVTGGLVTGRLAMRGLTFAGRLASRNPRAFGGSLTFAIAFSFVAANAMWYQPGVHPSPFLRTRLPLSDPQSAKISAGDDSLSPRKVTTFVIQREDEQQQTASIQQPQPERQAVSQAVQTEPAAIPATGAALVAGIQKELARRGLYDGPADGKSGPKTSAAILRFEKQTGRPETGSASDTLLAALQGEASPQGGAPQTRGKTLATAKPAQRPYENVKGGKGELDPVAAAIRNAEIDPQYIPKADIPASSELVMNIQKGLSNLAYSDVSVDGVAGEQTRSAIRHFEKHYRLPETGQPSDKVLKKMKEIGAL
ncbi:peptidoglycan-binding protein [Pararhizobium sp. YC-54]|uniref:peptidoglycan-binding domain-containing protein n=1 Tax=Pararhizobium sp. YC-54 TaxID=2986920 RepID=UPI0021F78AED|nr:peptidoglycan-binding protein [Pararhizobium sp. YC-54]MCV9997765.1 peptidoglycan-binding protein [Pararhizobium sp. YC-54]